MGNHPKVTVTLVPNNLASRKLSCWQRNQQSGEGTLALQLPLVPMHYTQGVHRTNCSKCISCVIPTSHLVPPPIFLMLLYAAPCKMSNCGNRHNVKISLLNWTASDNTGLVCGRLHSTVESSTLCSDYISGIEVLLCASSLFKQNQIGLLQNHYLPRAGTVQSPKSRALCGYWLINSQIIRGTRVPLSD